MVEFGLKLSDNKVEDWAHAYINYEALKNFLAAAQKAEKARDELENQNPALAADIKKQMETDDTSFTVNMDSDMSLNNADETSETQSLVSNTSSHFYGGTSSHVASSVHGSQEGFKKMKRTTSESSLAALIDATKAVTGYFQRSSYEQKMRKAIKNENAAIQNFRVCLYEEVSLHC